MRLFFQYHALELNKMMRGKIEVKTIQGQKWFSATRWRQLHCPIASDCPIDSISWFGLKNQTHQLTL